MRKANSDAIKSIDEELVKLNKLKEVVEVQKDNTKGEDTKKSKKTLKRCRY